jgi:ABC exporter DevB family membrane fusion protein
LKIFGTLLGISALMGLSLMRATLSRSHSREIEKPARATALDQTEAGMKILFASPGRVEPASGIVSVGAGISGLIVSVAVREGQRVSAGQVLAVLSCADLKAELARASAQLESAIQTRNRMLHGSREEERNESADRVLAAQAVMREAQSRYQRMAQLYAKDEISRQDFERTQLDVETAVANLQAAQHRQAVVNAPPMAEELAKQDAEIEAAKERQKSLLAKLEECTVKAPIGGTVLRRPMQPGEIFSVATPQPIVLLADLSRIRVRAEVDERDVGLLRTGQTARVLADAFPSEEFQATVAAIEHLMGRQKVRTGDPAEKTDRDVLEVLLDLSKTAKRLPVGLRVTVQFRATGTLT